MNKAELVSHVAAETSTTRAAAGRMVGAVFSAIADAPARAEPVAIAGSGKSAVPVAREIQSTASLLAALNDELASVSSEDRKGVAQARADAFKKLTEYSKCLESRFSLHLTLKH